MNAGEPDMTGSNPDMMSSYANPDNQQQEGDKMEAMMMPMIATMPDQTGGYEDPNLWVDDVREVS